MTERLQRAVKVERQLASQVWCVDPAQRRAAPESADDTLCRVDGNRPRNHSRELNSGQSAQFLSVSCASPGDCSGGGYYDDISTGLQAFVVSETHGSQGAVERRGG